MFCIWTFNHIISYQKIYQILSKSIQSRETSKSSPKGVINCLHLEFVLKTLRTLQKSTGSEWISVEKLSEAIRQVHTKWHASNDEAETLIQEVTNIL